MRTSEEFHKRRLDMLLHALQRPSIYCGTYHCADLFFGMVLSDLSWLDERESELAAIQRQLLHGSLRVYGQFVFQHLKKPDEFVNEIASTYAQAAYRLGFYKPTLLLNDADFHHLKSSINMEFFAVDHTLSEIVSRFGKPTHEVIGGETEVHCYGGCDLDADWIFFDYTRCPPGQRSGAIEYYEDAKLRDVRRRSNLMELLPFASWCRSK